MPYDAPAYRRHHLWGDGHKTMSDFNNTYVCPAPIAIQGSVPKNTVYHVSVSQKNQRIRIGIF